MALSHADLVTNPDLRVGTGPERPHVDRRPTCTIPGAPILEKHLRGFPSVARTTLDKLRDDLRTSIITTHATTLVCQPAPERAGGVGGERIYDTLPTNLRGACAFTIELRCEGRDGGQNLPQKCKFLLGWTTTTWVLLYGMSPDSFNDDRRFMHVDLTRRDVLRRASGEIRYLSEVTYPDVQALQRMVASEKTEHRRPLALALRDPFTERYPKDQHGSDARPVVEAIQVVSVTSQLVIPNTGGIISDAEFRTLLATATEVLAADGSFEVASFAEDIGFVFVQRKNGSAGPCEDDPMAQVSLPSHYFIISDPNRDSYYLYVNLSESEAQTLPNSQEFVAQFTCAGAKCVLYREV